MINTVTLQIDSIMSFNLGSEVFLPVAVVPRGRLSKVYVADCIAKERDETLMNNHRLS